MRICVVGVGYVGLVTAACLSDFGNNVICLDKDQKKIRNLKKTKIDFYELGLKELVAKNIKAGRLSFTTEINEALEKASIVFIAVGTPSLPSGDADLSALDAVAEKLGEYLKKANKDHAKVIVLKSTVPVGTAKRIAGILKRKKVNKNKYYLASNPEFLREGHAVYDFLHPDRIVIGAADRIACNIMSELYRPLNARLVFMETESSELVKYASNAFLANKISFINEIANICEKVGADIKSVAEGMGYDKRIGHEFLRAGIGYGGSCLPKDISALSFLAKNMGYKANFLDAISQVNAGQRQMIFAKLKAAVGELSGKTIGLWGLAFKPQTDDIREAPALFVIEALLKAGAKVKAYDPMTNDKVKKIFPDVEYLKDPYQVARGSDAVMVLTEWNEFKEVDLEKVRTLLKTPIIIDGRNIFNPMVLKNLKIKYYGIGIKG